MSGLSCVTQDLSLGYTDSLVVVCGLSCPEARGISVPGTGIELVSPALQNGFSTLGPPGKSQFLCFRERVTQDQRHWGIDPDHIGVRA